MSELQLQSLKVSQPADIDDDVIYCLPLETKLPTNYAAVMNYHVADEEGVDSLPDDDTLVNDQAVDQFVNNPEVARTAVQPSDMSIKAAITAVDSVMGEKDNHSFCDTHGQQTLLMS